MFFKNQESNVALSIIEPFILNLVSQNVPKKITSLYEKVAKFTQPLIDSLTKLKEKIKTSPTTIDDYCFNQGLNALETFAQYILTTVEEMRK